MSERLEIIKFLRNSEKTVAPGMQPSELISRKDVDWLIQQAERVEELKNRCTEIAAESTVREEKLLKEQNRDYSVLEIIK